MKVGIDTVEIKRIEKLYKKEGHNFLNRVFTEKEKQILIELEKSNSKQLYSKIAGKYAVKEAVYKALGAGISYNSIETLNYDNGKPYVKIYDSNNIECEKYNIEISITHDRTNAIAIAIIEERGQDV